MNTTLRTVHAAIGLFLVAFAGCHTATQVADEADIVEVRYELPDQEVAEGKSSVARWGMAAPVEEELANPNRIVYDQLYIEKYVHWAATTPIACGPATYVIVTPEGEQSIVSGLDAVYLGRRFSAEDLVEFLKQRAAGKGVERTFRVKHAEAARVLRENPESLAAKRLHESPWDQDTRMIIQLLGLAEYEPAVPPLVALSKDANPGVRFDAVIALGRLAGIVPAAIDELEKLLDDKESRGTAASALAGARERDLPAILRALDHPDWLVRNHMVHALVSADPAVAVPALQKALTHSDAEMRGWAAGVVADLVSRGGPEAGKPYVAELATRLREDPNENARRGAALALLNMKSLAAPAEAALRHAAEKDQNSQAQDYARRALEELKAEN